MILRRMGRSETPLLLPVKRSVSLHYTRLNHVCGCVSTSIRATKTLQELIKQKLPTSGSPHGCARPPGTACLGSAETHPTQVQAHHWALASI